MPIQEEDEEQPFSDEDSVDHENFLRDQTVSYLCAWFGFYAFCSFLVSLRPETRCRCSCIVFVKINFVYRQPHIYIYMYDIWTYHVSLSIPDATCLLSHLFKQCGLDIAHQNIQVGNETLHPKWDCSVWAGHSKFLDVLVLKVVWKWKCTKDIFTILLKLFWRPQCHDSGLLH